MLVARAQRLRRCAQLTAGRTPDVGPPPPASAARPRRHQLLMHPAPHHTAPDSLSPSFV